MSAAVIGRHFAPDVIPICMCWWCWFSRTGPPRSMLSQTAGAAVGRSMKVRCEWMVLDGAIGESGETLYPHRLRTRTTKAAKRFLTKALSRSPHERPSVISTHNNTHPNEAIACLRRKGQLAPNCRQRRVTVLNNRLGSDHGELTQRIRAVRGFQSQKTTHNATSGFETIRIVLKASFA
ncbi:DDE-type integrase/transposase/recombinase [Aureimonas sp. AU20]|uniref:DDE-type integrase/transposase/recombinase n=1 Tax=Aureimonas sp. AU20 TaxID=1349819 RepID=UPI0009EC4C0C|nr:DDE-type integrase/transposase/recombinase [Aureimonas sp. AU20]